MMTFPRTARIEPRQLEDTTSSERVTPAVAIVMWTVLSLTSWAAIVWTVAQVV